MKGQRLYESLAEIVGEDFCSENSDLLKVVCSKVPSSGKPQQSLLYALVMDAYDTEIISVVHEKYSVFLRTPRSGVLYDGTQDLIEKVCKYGQKVRRRMERVSA